MLKLASLSSILRTTSLVVLAWVVSYSANGQTLETLEFDEIPFRSVNDLEFAGVAFQYQIDGSDSNEAFYNSFGPGTLQFVDDPSLTGDARGVLSLEFDRPTAVLEFGVAVNSPVALTPGATVELFNANQETISTEQVDLLLLSGNLGFAENLFEHSGEAVKRFTISFATTGSFALDNLVFRRIPEPVSLHSLALLGILMWMGRRGKRRFQ